MSSNSDLAAAPEQFDPVSESVERGDGEVLIKAQLALENKLQEVCQQLIRYYKEGHNWPAVSQIAQNLITNAHRIARLKSQLQNGQEESANRGLDSITESEDDSSDENIDSSADLTANGTTESVFANGIGSGHNMEDQAKVGDKEVAISVTRAGDADTNSSEICYRVEAHTLESQLDSHIPPSNRFVLHSLEDFQELRKSLVSKGEVPELCVTICEPRDNQEAQSDCHNLSKFLNGVVRDPALRSEPEVLDFLSRGRAVRCSTESAEPQTQKGL